MLWQCDSNVSIRGFKEFWTNKMNGVASSDDVAFGL